MKRFIKFYNDYESLATIKIKLLNNTSKKLQFFDARSDAEVAIIVMK